MKRIAITILLTAGLVGCNIHIGGLSGVQGSGKRTSETRNVGEFTGVALDAAANVDVKIGDRPSLVIEGDDNLLPLITTQVKEGVLIIANEESYNTKIGIQIHLTTPMLASTSIAGAGSIRAGAVESRKFATSVSGSGNIEIEQISSESFEATLPGSGNIEVKNLKARTVVASVDGSGAIELSGSADQLEASVSGAGNLQLGALATEDATVSVAGSGSADVQVADKLIGTVAGSGSIHYSGKPKVVKREISGSGSIEAN
jgi:hypothetical protein